MPTLKDLVDETTKIKDEVIDCHTALQQKLTDNNIQFPAGEKLRPLIDRIGGLSTITGDNIIAATSLPSNGKKGQLCIVTPNAPGKIHAGRIKLNPFPIGDIWLVPTEDTSFPLETVVAGDKSFSFRVGQAFQMGAGNVELISPIWKWNDVDSKWERLVEIRKDIFIENQGIVDQSVLSGGYNEALSTSCRWGNIVSSIMFEVICDNTNIPNYAYSAYRSPIDVTNYTSMVVEYDLRWDALVATNYPIQYSARFGLNTSNAVDTGTISMGYSTGQTTTVSGNIPRQKATIDLSRVSGNYYLKFALEATAHGAYMNIYNIYLEA